MASDRPGRWFCALALAACVGCSKKAENPQSAVHPPDWMDPLSSRFHGTTALAVLVSEDSTDCQSCHGADYRGGTSGSDCVACHQLRGPGECTGCHGGHDNNTGAPPLNLDGQGAPADTGVGSHTTMVEGFAYSDGFDCVECHQKPAFVFADGHFETDELDGSSRAEMTFSSLANPDGRAQFHANTRQCTNIYCHGNFAGGANATVNFRQRWDTTSTDTAGYISQGQVACGTCHVVSGAFPSWDSLHQVHTEAPQLLDCAVCHSGLATLVPQPRVLDRVRHVNGAPEVVLGSQAGAGADWDPQARSCASLDVGCHGGQTRFWPRP